MSLNKRLITTGPASGGSNFGVVTYTGNSDNDYGTDLTQSITGVGFQPDWVWIKGRDGYTHAIFDSTRGVTYQITPNSTAAQSNSNGYLKSFDADGFGLGGDYAFNREDYTYVAWCLKANGGTTSSNTDGSITSTVQVNAEAGFSIVQYTGTQANATVGHGLGIAPKMIMTKALGSTQGWPTLAVGATTNFYGLRLNESNANNAGNGAGFFQNFTPDSSIFKLGSSDESNANGQTTIAYCFADVSGQSKISGYDGTGSALSITGLGFQPDFLLLKCAESTEQWYMWDSARGASKFLHPNLDNSEGTDATTRLTSFDSDGFSLGTDGAVNASGSEYIYLAFKIS